MQSFLETLTSESKMWSCPKNLIISGSLSAAGKSTILIIAILIRLKANGIFHGFLMEWQFRMLLSCPVMNTERRFASIIPVRVHGILPIVIQEKLCGLKRENETI